MSSQTSLVAKQCRIQSWALQIKDCQNRPVGMTVGEWCIQNNITKADYYYRLKCVRQACLDSMESTPAFVELPVPEIKSARECAVGSTAAAVIRGTNLPFLHFSHMPEMLFVLLLPYYDAPFLLFRYSTISSAQFSFNSTLPSLLFANFITAFPTTS